MAKTEAQARTEFIEKKFLNKTDRQLLEEQVHLSLIQNEYLKSIKNNILFFFWITLLGLAIYFIAYIISEASS